MAAGLSRCPAAAAGPVRGGRQRRGPAGGPVGGAQHQRRGRQAGPRQVGQGQEEQQWRPDAGATALLCDDGDDGHGAGDAEAGRGLPRLQHRQPQRGHQLQDWAVWPQPGGALGDVAAGVLAVQHRARRGRGPPHPVQSSGEQSFDVKSGIFDVTGGLIDVCLCRCGASSCCWKTPTPA